jgi:predicted dehydrogenase
MRELLIRPLPVASPSTQHRLPRIGFAGVGWIGRNRLESIRATGLAEVAAVVDSASDLAADVSAACGGCPHSTDFDTLLDQGLDGIVIATPSALHAGQSIAALQQGIAVFCQKPLARNGAEAATVVAAAEKADRLLGVDFSYRFTRGMQAIRQLVLSGELGHVFAVEAVFHNAYGPDKPWFHDRKQSGGGCLLDLGIHLVDLSLWCLGFPVVKHAEGSFKRNGKTGFDLDAEVEDYASGLIELENDSSVQLACSWGAHAGCDARIELTFLGTRGGASFRNVGGSFYDFTAEHLLPDRSRRKLADPPDSWGGRAAVDWVERLGRSHAFDPAARHLIEVAAAIDALYARQP